MSNYVTTAAAAKEMGVSRVWVQRLIKAGRANAVRIGRDYLISLDEVKRLKSEERKKTGRPPKAK